MNDSKPIPTTLEVVNAKAAEVTVQQSGSLLELLINKNVDVAMLEKAMDLQERHDKNEARKAYVKAMAAFKAEPPTLYKSSHVGFKSKKPGVGPTEYDHATLGDIVPSIVASLSRNGLHHNWMTEQVEGRVKITCVITHEQGHSEQTSLVANADNTGNKNAIQAVGSTISYLQRYTLLSLTGLAAQDTDDDGIGAEPVMTITPEQVVELVAIGDKAKADTNKFFDYFDIGSMEDLPSKRYAEAKTLLNKQLRALQKKAAKDA